ncbi:MAG: MG2 domain-containing protein, partial [Candidatus Thorarchaeota archaeon]
MNRISKFRLTFTLVFIINLFLLSPILSASQFTQGNPNSNISLNSSPILNNENGLSAPNYEIRKAPELNSFFESYSDENYIKAESYLPDQINDNSDLSTQDSNSHYFSANIDLSKVAYSFGETVYFTVQLYEHLLPASNIQLTIIILAGDTYYYWAYQYGDYQIVKTISATTDGNGFYEGVFNPPTEGTYTIVVIPTLYSTYSVARRVVTVSDIALFWRAPYEAITNASTLSYAMVVSTEDFSPISNANVTLYKELWYQYNDYTREKISSYLTDETGLLVFEYEMFKGDSDYYYLTLVAEKDGSSTELRQYQYFNDYNSYDEDIYQKYSFITTSDKPIYQPGDTILTRTIVFYEDYWKVSKELARNTEVEFEFQNTKGYTLYHNTLTTDDYGVIEWTFNFDEDTKLGNYYIIFRKEESSNTFTIEVDTYEKPDFRVTINLEKEYVPPKDYIKGEIVAEYYFGKPVPGAVLLEFVYFETVLGSITGTLNSKGIFTFSWQVPKYKPNTNEPIEALVVHATVTDIVDRTVIAQKDVTCQSTLYSYIWTYPYGIVKKGEEVQIIFNAFQSGAHGDYYGYYWTPIANAKVILTVYGITQYLRQKKLFEINTQTNEYGRGIEKLTIPDTYFDKYKTFVIESKVMTEDGRVGEDYTALAVALVEAQISITPQDNINPGDSIKITIKFFNIKTGELVKGKASIYVMDSEYDTICSDWDISTDGYEEITIKLSNYAPDGNYRINTYFRYDDYGSYFFPKFASGMKEFCVGENYYISLQTTQNSYSSSDRLVLLGKRSHIGSTPTIIELTKRGIVDVYTINGLQQKFELIIDDLTGLAPKFTIFAYAITVTGLIIEEYKIITVDEELNVSIESDKETYEPGDSASISIQVTNENGEFVDAMSVFSLIDSSIFGVKEDNLAEEEFFENDRYWCEVTTCSSWTAPMYRWWYWWAYEDEYYDYLFCYSRDTYTEGAFGDDSIKKLSDLEFSGEIRDYLPESAFWMPELEITDGKVDFTITLPDNIGEWTVRLFVTTETQGLIAKHTFKTFLPFFVDLKLPQGPIQDNVIVVRGIAYNYLNSSSSVQLSIDVAGLTLINNQTQSIVIPKDYLVEIRWSIYCNDFGDFNITLTGIALTDTSTSYDGIRKSMNIQPNGITYTQAYGGFLNGSDTMYYELFEESVYTSVDLVISPGMMNLAVDSWERLIGYPYGCMEQTMSKVFPDVLIYQYLKDNGLLTPTLENRLITMLQIGLSRISSFQHDNGGWGWWYDDASQPFMTAVILYGLGLLTDINFNLDPTQIKSAANYLASNQLTSGAFSTDSWRLDDLSFTAYVIRSLTSLELSASWEIAMINDAVDYFIATWNAGSSLKNPYAAALFIDGTIGTSYENSAFIEQLETYILSETISIGDGIKWTSFDDDAWHALGGDIETTASVVVALAKIDYVENFVIIKKALNWLLSLQNNYGWGSTADTSAAIRAIITIADYSSIPLNCTIEISIDSWSTEIEYNESSSNSLIAN